MSKFKNLGTKLASGLLLGMVLYSPVLVSAQSQNVSQSFQLTDISKYTSVSDFSNGIAQARLGEMHGVINTNGDVIIPFEYSSIFRYDNGFIEVKKGDKYGIMDSNGNTILPIIYDSIYIPKNDELFGVVFKDNKCGYLNKELKLITDVSYDIPSYSNTWSTGSPIILFVGNVIRPFKEEAVVYKNGKYGFIDTTGKEIIPPTFDFARVFDGEWAAVQLNGQYLYVNRSGDITESLSGERELIQFNSPNGMGYMDAKTHEVVIPPIYGIAPGFSEGFVSVSDIESKLFAYFNEQGEAITPFKYYSARQFKDGVAVVCVRSNSNNNRYGLIDTTGKEITPLKYTSIHPTDSGSFKVECVDETGRFINTGYMDTKGNEVIPAIYRSVRPNKELGLCEVSRMVDGSEKVGFVDFKGNEVVPCKYTYVSAFEDGFSKGTIQGDSLSTVVEYFDMNGNIVYTTTVSNPGPLKDGLIRITSNDTVKYINTSGQTVIPAEYSSGGDFNDGTAIVYKGSKRYALTLQPASN